MAEDLRGLGVPFDKVDIDADPALAARYGTRVPVLAERDGIEICHGRLDRAGLRARLGLE
jgi:hypothetical protein